MVEDGTFLDQSERREVDIQKLLRELQVSGRIQDNNERARRQWNIAGRLARGIRSRDSLDGRVLMGMIRADGRLSCRP